MPVPEDNYLNKISTPKVADAVAKNDMKAAWLAELADLNVCSQKGLVEMLTVPSVQEVFICRLVGNTSSQRHSLW